MYTEFEIKFLDINEDNLISKLKLIGGALLKPKTLMKRQVFHFNPNVAKEDKWARVRDEGGKITMSIKHVIDKNKIDGTKEVELNVNNFSEAINFLVEAGLLPSSYQENYRETWEYKKCILTFDTWPGLNTFVEIEGNGEDEVKQVVSELGFDFKDGVFGSIDLIYSKKYNINRDTITNARELTFENVSKVLNFSE